MSASAGMPLWFEPLGHPLGAVGQQLEPEVEREPLHEGGHLAEVAQRLAGRRAADRPADARLRLSACLRLRCRRAPARANADRGVPARPGADVVLHDDVAPAACSAPTSRARRATCLSTSKRTQQRRHRGGVEQAGQRTAARGRSGGAGGRPAAGGAPWPATARTAGEAIPMTRPRGPRASAASPGRQAASPAASSPAVGSSQDDGRAGPRPAAGPRPGAGAGSPSARSLRRRPACGRPPAARRRTRAHPPRAPPSTRDAWSGAAMISAGVSPGRSGDRGQHGPGGLGRSSGLRGARRRRFGQPGQPLGTRELWPQPGDLPAQPHHRVVQHQQVRRHQGQVGGVRAARPR